MLTPRLKDSGRQGPGAAGSAQVFKQPKTGHSSLFIYTCTGLNPPMASAAEAYN